MLVVNTEPRHHNIGDIITLAPGVNDVPDDLWSRCKSIPTIKDQVEAGVLKEVLSARGKPITDIAKLPAADAIELVKQTVDLELLGTWRDGTKGPLAKAIDEQVALLKKKD